MKKKSFDVVHKQKIRYLDYENDKILKSLVEINEGKRSQLPYKTEKQSLG
jgi:hypothetical protein